MTIDAAVLIGEGPDSLEGTKVTTPAGTDLFREGVVISDPDVAEARAKITNTSPASDAYGLAVRVIGGVVVGSEVEIKNDIGNPVPVSGSVSVSNFPATQAVSGTVSVGNFPATQAVSGTVTANLGALNGAATAAKQLPDNHNVTVSNFPAKQTIADSTDSEYLRIATSVTTAGDTTLVTPSAGKRIRLQWVYAINDPTASVATKLTIKLGTAVQYVAWAISKRQQLTGAVDAPLVINLSQAGDVAVTVFYQEV